MVATTFDDGRRQQGKRGSRRRCYALRVSCTKGPPRHICHGEQQQTSEADGKGARAWRPATATALHVSTFDPYGSFRLIGPVFGELFKAPGDALIGIDPGPIDACAPCQLDATAVCSLIVDELVGHEREQITWKRRQRGSRCRVLELLTRSSTGYGSRCMDSIFVVGDSLQLHPLRRARRARPLRRRGARRACHTRLWGP